MKQFAFSAALLASFASAFYGQHSPALIVSYENQDNYFLGLEHDNPATVKFPKDWKVFTGFCSGWQLLDSEQEYDSFEIELVEPEYDARFGCKKMVFTAKHLEDGMSYGREEVVLVNDCGWDDGMGDDEFEDAYMVINVQVFPPEQEEGDGEEGDGEEGDGEEGDGEEGEEEEEGEEGEEGEEEQNDD